ncbi:MAG: MATE family efflux transporter [Candidatus Cloacimonas sp. SDB]|nr:MAG: MATE family efflux transporter [Candidatus Cloacimonas sp. SDB]
MKEKHILANDDIKKLLFKLSLPATAGMIVMALYNVVDTIFIGRSVGSLGIAGLSIVFPVQMMVLALGQMIGLGSASVISRSLGAGEREKARRVLGTTATFTLIISVFLTLLGLIFIDPLLKIFGVTETIYPYSYDYMRIILLGTFFFAFAMNSNHVIRSEGQAKYAMLAMMLGAGLNIILDPIFIFALDMGVKGAATATVLAQIVAVIYVIIFFQSKKSTLHLNFRSLGLNFKLLQEIIKIGFSAFARHVSGSLIFIVVNNTLKLYNGDIAIAAYGIIMRLFRFLLMPMFGIAQGLQPIVGFNYGAGKIDKLQKAYKTAIIYASIISFSGFMVIQLFSRTLFGIFTSDPELIELGSNAIRIMVLAVPLIGFQMIGTVVFQALGKALPALILSMSRELIILIPLILILPRFYGLNGVWYASPISDILSFSLTAVLFYRLIKQLDNEQESALKRADS